MTPFLLRDQKWLKTNQNQHANTHTHTHTQLIHIYIKSILHIQECTYAWIAHAHAYMHTNCLHEASELSPNHEVMDQLNSDQLCLSSDTRKVLNMVSKYITVMQRHTLHERTHEWYILHF